MANGILSPEGSAHTHQYQLDPQARQAILAQSHYIKTSLKIERQRVAFVEKNGSNFGDELLQKPQK